MLMERHARLRAAAHTLYAVPGTRMATRLMVRQAAQCLPLSLKSRQQLYNFFARDVSPAGEVTCRVWASPGRTIRLRLDLQNELSQNWYYWGYTGYEPGTTRIFRRLLRSKSCVFDVGANLGYYTLLAAALLGDRGQVHAFEPVPNIYARLTRNAALNRFPCLHLKEAALSDRDGRAPLFLPSNPADTVSASLISGYVKQSGSVDVDVMRFDTYCAENRIDSVDLVRIDAEGAEGRVLQGMGALLDRWLPDIICEVVRPPIDTLHQIVERRPYRKFLITRWGLEEVDEITIHPRFRDYYLSRDPILT